MKDEGDGGEGSMCDLSPEIYIAELEIGSVAWFSIKVRIASSLLGTP